MRFPEQILLIATHPAATPELLMMARVVHALTPYLTHCVLSIVAQAAGAAPSAAAAVGLAAMEIVPETRDGFETVPATPTATPGSAPSSSAFKGAMGSFTFV